VPPRTVTASKGQNVRAFLSAIILFFVALGLFGWSGFEMIAATTGEQASAVVSNCVTTPTGRRNRTRTDCYGTVAGASARTKVNGVGRDDVGKTVSVRVHGGEAYAFSWASVLVPAGAAVLMLLGSLVWLVIGLRARSRRQQAAAYAWRQQYYAHQQRAQYQAQYPRR
jgi:hypothetical protein